MDDNEFSFIKNLIGDTHDEEAPAPVQEMPPSAISLSLLIHLIH